MHRQRQTTALLLILCQCVAVAAATVMVQGPHYIYKLSVNRDPTLCSHMNEVFNSRFASLWNIPMLDEADPVFATDGPYTFPRIPDVKHDYSVTFAMLSSKVPSSPEFDAIPWREGRAIFGEPKETAAPANDTLLPILVTRVDFYNDGHIDTVIKKGFTKGYSYMTGSGGSGLDDELITVIRDEKVVIGPVLSLYDLRKSVPPNLTNTFDAAYERPFIFQGQTYMARYDIDPGENTPRPNKELMTVLRYYLPADVSNVQTPSQETICQFRMIQQVK